VPSARRRWLRLQAQADQTAQCAGRIRSRIGTALSATPLINSSKGKQVLVLAFLVGGCPTRHPAGRRNPAAATRVPASPARTGTDRWVPALPPGQAPSDRGRQRPPRPGCLIPCHPVPPVSPPGRVEGCCCYTFYYSSRNAKALSRLGKGLDLRKLVAGAGFEPATSGL
jgi:hypothetical protein